MGDCKLTEDNKYFVGLFTTNHAQSISTVTPTFNRINSNSYAYSYKFSTNGEWGVNPYYNNFGGGWCN
jgi:hypothetical protein